MSEAAVDSKLGILYRFCIETWPFFSHALLNLGEIRYLFASLVIIETNFDAVLHFQNSIGRYGMILGPIDA